MNTNTQSDVQERLVNRLQWQNRFLVMILCLMGCFTLVAATKNTSVVSAGEIMANRIVIVDDKGQQVYYWQGKPKALDRNGVLSYFY